MIRSRIDITLTLPNGNTRSVKYEIADDAYRAHVLFNTLKDAAWAASVYERTDNKEAHA